MRLANLSPNSVPLLKTDPGCGIKMQIRGFGRGATDGRKVIFSRTFPPSIFLKKEDKRPLVRSCLRSLVRQEKRRVSRQLLVEPV